MCFVSRRLRHFSFSTEVGTDPAIIAYIRFRGWTKTDDVTISSGHDIIFDHCSFSWALDENWSIFAPGDDPVERVTLQNSIISVALQDTRLCQTHSNGLEISGEECNERWRRVQGISIHHNWFAGNNARNPRVNAFDLSETINNLIYNHRYKVFETKYQVRSDWVNNYIRLGPARDVASATCSNLGDSTGLCDTLMMAQDRDFATDNCGSPVPPLCCINLPAQPACGYTNKSPRPSWCESLGGNPAFVLGWTPSIYTDGTIIANRSGTIIKATGDEEWNYWSKEDVSPREFLPLSPVPWRRSQRNGQAPYGVTVWATANVPNLRTTVGVYQQRRCNADSWNVGTRDSVDAQLLLDYNAAPPAGSATVLTLDVVRSSPVFDPGTGPACQDASNDTDVDGMPNSWESARGLNPSINDALGDDDSDGYTNIEAYIWGISKLVPEE